MKRLTSMTVRDFRSIRGSVTIPLDSPVVLVHGRNGAGKTSLLSALELGLTGRVSSFDWLEESSGEHLVHKQAESAAVSLSVSGFDPVLPSSDMIIDGGISGTSVLPDELRSHYTERCYLGQSTLSRLFEIYQTKGKTAASPLTSFVKELLGLDALEALIDGLHSVADVRRLRGNAVRYWEVRDLAPAAHADVLRLKSEVEAAEAQAKQLSDEVGRLIATHWPEFSHSDTKASLAFVRGASRENELSLIASRRREVAELASQVRREEATSEFSALEQAEASAKHSQAELDRWLASTGKRLDEVIVSLGSMFPELPSPSSSKPDYVRSVTLRLAATEQDRCRSILQRHDAAVVLMTALQTDIDGLNIRLRAIDDLLTQHSTEAGQLAQSLSTVIPHIHSEQCPICDRDFGETSSTPLLGYITAKVASLTQSAGQLSALSSERADTLKQIDSRKREIDTLRATLLDESTRSDVAGRMVKSSDASSILEALELDTKRGEALYVASSEAWEALEVLRLRGERGKLIRESAEKMIRELGLSELGEADTLASVLESGLRVLEEREKSIQEGETARQKAESSLRDLEVRERSISEIKGRLTNRTIEYAKLSSDLEKGDLAIENAKSLLKLAQAERVEIVRRVFNDSLNSAWNDLFIRLAPEEPFVPAFSVPSQSRSGFQANLETLYRDGGRGGNPREMLSAGNLNTAALTLFLALHLSAKPHLPWLVIDDPVQSMDEVHISQFAALLRTLSKQHNRQVIIAVHEKPLFDYLCLELSPSFSGDRLIAIELGRAPDGKTVASCSVKDWREDRAIAA